MGRDPEVVPAKISQLCGALAGCQPRLVRESPLSGPALLRHLPLCCDRLLLTPVIPGVNTALSPLLESRVRSSLLCYPGAIGVASRQEF